MNADEPAMDWWEGLVDNNGITIEISPKNLKKIKNFIAIALAGEGTSDAGMCCK